jgi:hypothetical protein
MSLTCPSTIACCVCPTAELHAAAAKPALRAEGVLQRISGKLLQQVPFTVLQAQVGLLIAGAESSAAWGAFTNKTWSNF